VQFGYGLNYLVDIDIEFSSAPRTLERLQQISANIHAFRALIVGARNRFISHLDLEAIWIGEPLGAAPTEKWEQFWIDLSPCSPIQPQ